MTSPWLITCVGTEADLPLLPHWLDHYTAIGIEPDRIVCILNASDAGAPELAAARALLAERGVRRVRDWLKPYTSEAMWAVRREAQRAVAAPEDWVLSADVDEFHAYPEALPAFLARCEGWGVTCVQGPFIDRLAPGGRLAPVSASPDLAAQFPLRAEASLSLFGEGASHNRYGTVKVMAMRGHVMPSRGGHHPTEDSGARFLYGAPLAAFGAVTTPGFRFALPAWVDHYHWTATLPERLRRRLATPGVSVAGAEYGARQLRLLGPDLTVPLDAVALRGGAPDGDWTRAVARLRRQGLIVRKRRALGAVLARARAVTGATARSG